MLYVIIYVGHHLLPPIICIGVMCIYIYMLYVIIYVGHHPLIASNNLCRCFIYIYKTPT